MRLARLCAATLILFVGGNASSQDGAGPKKQAPKRLSNANDWRVGERIPDFTAADTAGKSRSLADLIKDRKALVFVFTAIDCPLSKLYRPKVERLEKEFRDRGVGFVLAYCVPTDKPDVSGLEFPAIHDKTGSLASLLRATHTTDAFVLDSQQVLQYRGAIDDQYGMGYKNETAKENYLVDAIEAVLGGKEVAVKATEAPG